MFFQIHEWRFWKMATSDGFVDKVRRELSAEEMAGLRAYSASTDAGSVVFVPIIKKFGQEIRWSARVHVKGASGPLPLSRASLRAINAPESWADKSRTFLEALEREHPSLEPGFPERRGLSAG